MLRSWALAMLCTVIALGDKSGASGCGSGKLLARSTRVVGGGAISIEDAPWHVSLVYAWNATSLPICGGSIISSDWVITAAHCVDGIRITPQPLEFISAGSRDYMTGSRHTIAQKITHPLYEVRHEISDVAVNDISLLRVAEPFEFDRTRQPIPLYVRAHRTLSQSQATISGSGAINVRGDAFGFGLKAATMKITPISKCIDFLSRIYQRSGLPTGQICAESLSGTICNADSGGPLTVNGTLVGIASWMNSSSCPLDETAVFTEVARYRYWISEITLL